MLRDIAQPFHSTGANIRSNADQLSTAVQRLAATTAEQSSGSPRPRRPWRSWPGIGVASSAEDGWEGLVRRADTGLYAAKEGGRNRVVAGPPAEAGSRTPVGENAAR